MSCNAHAELHYSTTISVDLVSAHSDLPTYSQYSQLLELLAGAFGDLWVVFVEIGRTFPLT
eukprot:604785-Hanusia_phi.AAC.1